MKGDVEEGPSNGEDRGESPAIEWLPVSFRNWGAFLEHTGEVTWGQEVSSLAPWSLNFEVHQVCTEFAVGVLAPDRLCPLGCSTR